MRERSSIVKGYYLTPPDRSGILHRHEKEEESPRCRIRSERGP